MSSSSPLPLDPSKIRAHFPAFSEASLQGQAFFENAGGAYTSKPVLDLLDHYYHATKVQPYGTYAASEAAGSAMDFAYARIGAALGVSADWIHFGPSTSNNTYVLSQAFKDYLKSGDAIIVTNQDHEANSGAWRRLEKTGIEIREWQVDPQSGQLNPDDLDKLLDSKVKCVTFPHCSNVVGHINPATEICARAKAAGALAIVDGVSYAPHGLPDVAAMGADIYMFSAYKTYGPHQGIMAIRPELAAALPNQGHYFNDTKLRYRLTPAGPDHAQIAACAGVADYLETVADLAGPEIEGANKFRRANTAIRAQETVLMQPLLDWINANSNRVRLIGSSTAANRAPTIALALNEPGRDVAIRLAKHGIMAGGGHFYAVRLMEALGIDPERGVLRLSFTHYTSPAEIEALIKALDAEIT